MEGLGGIVYVLCKDARGVNVCVVCEDIGVVSMWGELGC